MKKFLYFIFLVLILTSCSKNQEKKVEEIKEQPKEKTALKIEKPKPDYVKVDFVSESISPNIPKYTIEKDLKNVVNRNVLYDENNMEYFKDEMAEIEKDGFTINKYYYEQPFLAYEQNEYLGISNFVTTDSMLSLYHVFYDNLLRNLEEQKFLPIIEELIGKTSEEVFNNKDEFSKKEQIYFATAQKLLGKDIDADSDVLNASAEEIEKINSENSNTSSVTQAQIDYSIFKPRGHYTKSEDLKKYFKIMSFLSQEKFYLFDDTNKPIEENIEISRSITKALKSNPDLYEKFIKMDDIINLLVESSENLSPRDFSQIAEKTSDMNEIIEILKNYKDKEISKHEKKFFALYPQKAVVDSIWLQNLVDDNNNSMRPAFNGLDILSILGSKSAMDIALSDEQNNKWESYGENLKKTVNKVENLSDDFYKENLYRGWIWMLRDYMHERGEGYPIFMQNEKWMKKDWQSALGSYTQLKHDTVLYGEQASAEMGGGESYPIKNYVEPNLEIFQKLDYLLRFSKENLSAKEMLNDTQIKAFDNFISLNKFLIDCVKKELNNEIISDKDNERLTYIGGEMENIFINFVDPKLKFFDEIENIGDRNMTIVTDLMKVPENAVGVTPGYLEFGLGLANEIVVVYPIGDKLYIGTGAVFNFHEFISDKRLTDEEFRMKLINDEENKFAVPDYLN